MTVWVVTEQLGSSDETKIVGVFSSRLAASDCRLRSLARRRIAFEVDAWVPPTECLGVAY